MQFAFSEEEEEGPSSSKRTIPKYDARWQHDETILENEVKLTKTEKVLLRARLRPFRIHLKEK